MGDTHFSGNVVAAGFENSDGSAVGASYAVIPIRIGNVGAGATVSRTVTIGAAVVIDEVVAVGFSHSAAPTDGGDLTLRVGASSISAPAVYYVNDQALTALALYGDVVVNGTNTNYDTSTLYVRIVSGTTGQSSDTFIYVTVKLKAAA